MNANKTKNAKHQNQVRITGGQLRGRKIQFSNTEGLRPTPDMVREKLFNWLGQDLTGWRVLDLFSGSGVLGFECASRHARHIDMCELNSRTVQTIKQYACELSCDEQIKVHHQNGLAFLQTTSTKYDLVLLDPPFAWQGWILLFERLSDCLNTNAFVYVEAGQLPDFPDWLSIYREGRTGQSQYRLLQYKQDVGYIT